MNGVVAIIFGLVLLVFPWFGLWTLAVILGLILISVGVGLLVLGAFTYRASKVAGLAFLILGIIGLVVGVGMFGNFGALATLTSVALYVSGFILLASGLVHFFKPRTRFSREVGVAGILLGVIYIILGSYAADPRGLSILMGIWLILAGITSLV
jgi:uncharacterized membrane protein HdeD (DUF308 family)